MEAEFSLWVVDAEMRVLSGINGALVDLEPTRKTINLGVWIVAKGGILGMMF